MTLFNKQILSAQFALLGLEQVNSTIWRVKCIRNKNNKPYELYNSTICLNKKANCIFYKQKQYFTSNVNTLFERIAEDMKKVKNI